MQPGKLKEGEIQTKITETWKELPKKVQNEYLRTEEDMRRKKMRNIKENLWKKWRTSREKVRKREKEEVEVAKAKTLEEKLEKLEAIKQRVQMKKKP